MTSSWQLQPIFGSYLLVATLVGILLLLLFVSPRFGSLTKPRKRWLTILRSLIALLLAIAMLRPALVTIDRKTQQALVLILFDASRSMTYRDGSDGKTRWEDQLSLLKQAIPKLENLGESFTSELIAFAGNIDPQLNDSAKIQVKAKPVGGETDLGQAITEALKRHAGKRLAAMVLISDGAQRAISVDVPPQQAARQLDRRAAPLYTIALGRSRDQSQARDISVANLQDEYSVFVKNEFALRVGFRIQGYVNRPIPVSLFIEKENGQREKVGAREIVATEDSQTVMADFSYRAEEAGQFSLLVEAEAQEGELIENNKATAFLKVRDGGLRVLLLTSTSNPLQESKFIRRSLNESREIELDFQLINVLRRDEWPVNLGEDLDFENYDVFVVGDVDARALQPDNWAKIAALVEAGRGFMMYGGFHSFGPGNFAQTPIGNLLPVELKRAEREPDPVKFSRVDQHLTGEVQVLPKGSSTIMHLAPEDANRDAWSKLKAVRGANKLGKLKDRATVIAESQDSDPLIVQGQYVAGRVLVSAIDSTYRWWMYEKPEAHKRFWRQCVLWLARRDKQEANTAFIDLPQRRYMAGTRVEFQAGLTDEVGDPILDADLRVSVVPPDGSPIPVELGQTNEGFQGLIPKDKTGEPGIYRIQVVAMDGATEIASTYSDIVVVKEDFELSDPAANPGLLDMLARRTSRVGGKAIAPEQLPGLLDQIKASPPKNEIELQAKRQLGDTPTDAWLAFGILVFLLSLEWFLRKKWGLV